MMPYLPCPEPYRAFSLQDNCTLILPICQQKTPRRRFTCLCDAPSFLPADLQPPHRVNCHDLWKFLQSKNVGHTTLFWAGAMGLRASFVLGRIIETEEAACTVAGVCLG
jgi:hypothetical protein